MLLISKSSPNARPICFMIKIIAISSLCFGSSSVKFRMKIYNTCKTNNKIIDVVHLCVHVAEQVFA